MLLNYFTKGVDMCVIYPTLRTVPQSKSRNSSSARKCPTCYKSRELLRQPVARAKACSASQPKIMFLARLWPRNQRDVMAARSMRYGP